MDLLKSILIGILISLIAAEIVGEATRISRWLIRVAASKLPEHARSRYHEEWLAHLDEVPGLFGKLRHAASCRFKVVFVRAALIEPDPEKIQRLARYIFRALILPRFFPVIAVDLLRGRISQVRFGFYMLNRVIDLIVEYKFKRNATDAQLKNMLKSYVAGIEKIVSARSSKDDSKKGSSLASEPHISQDAKSPKDSL